MKHKDILPEPGNPFANCKLNREKYANVLTKIVYSYSDGFVLSINNRWGTGKTTFVKMWQQQLIDSGFETIYLNAWENDFEDNPLAAIMGELRSLTNNDNKEDFIDIVKRVAVIAKKVAPDLVAGYVAKKTGIDDLTTYAKNASEGFLEMFQKDVEEYSKKKDSIRDFRKKLASFINAKTRNKPLVFIIDELDRCRPNYAVSVLEQIKHFFSVEGIVFVLSIDKEQLGNAVRGVYGTDLIDSEEYLRRFIDIEYSIPEPDRNKFIDYLFNYFKFQEFFEGTRKDTMKPFKEVMKLLLNKPSMSLRQQEKLLAHTRLSLNVFKNEHSFYPTLFFFLNYIRIFEKKMFTKIRNKEYSLSHLQKEFLNIFKGVEESEILAIMQLEAHLVYFYNSYKEESPTENIFARNPSTYQQELLISSHIKPGHESFAFYLKRLYDGMDSLIELDYFLDKVELFEDLRL